ncbi:MAG: hypothetical protein JOZ78_09290 [Chroococcidiopsidaceae cyanobacterium CP_BM_ER_R8_30]|nr:hypothetical protein [Chroococcidiopsidaceae cyanobacterium CP_BM_ER_R8_30]
MFLIHNSIDQAPLLAAAVVGACRGDGWDVPLQPRFLSVLFEKLLGFKADFETLEPTTPQAARDALPSLAQRLELIELMVSVEVISDPIPPWLSQLIERWAKELGVEDRSLVVARDLAQNAKEAAKVDFYRLNWIGALDQKQPDFQQKLERAGIKAWALTVEADREEAQRWDLLKNCPAGSIGRALWNFYQKRGFAFPGTPGAVNKAVARHDWVHVLADYDTTPMGEMEVLAFMASSSRVPGTTLGFIGTIGIYESGLLPSLVVPPGCHHSLSVPGGPERIADAIRRGKSCHQDPLMMDYFAIDSCPLDELRRAWGIPEKADIAMNSNSH